MQVVSWAQKNGGAAKEWLSRGQQQVKKRSKYLGESPAYRCGMSAEADEMGNCRWCRKRQ